MNSLGQLLAFGVGSLCLGVALTLWTVSTISSHRAGTDRSEMYLATFICLIPLGVAVYSFAVALGLA